MNEKQALITQNPSWIQRFGGKKFLATCFVAALYFMCVLWALITKEEIIFEFITFAFIPVLGFVAAYAGLEIVDKFLQLKK